MSGLSHLSWKQAVVNSGPGVRIPPPPQNWIVMVKGYFVYLAHLVERKTDNFDVIGSIPIVYFLCPFQFSFNFNLGSCQSGLCMGLQNLLGRFDSATTLKYYSQSKSYFKTIKD